MVKTFITTWDRSSDSEHLCDSLKIYYLKLFTIFTTICNVIIFFQKINCGSVHSFSCMFIFIIINCCSLFYFCFLFPLVYFGLFKNLFHRRQWQPTPVLLLGKSHGWRSLLGCSPWGREESDTTERLPFHFSLSCTGEGNGNPLQCSCLENPRDGGAWWAAVYGVTQSQTWLKWLSSKCKECYLDPKV